MSERYVLDTKPHAEGGFGKVHRGRDSILDRDVALKILDPLAKRFEEADRARFLREAKILASLSHQSIPAIYDVLFTKDSFSIVLEFIEGGTLADLIHDDGPCQLVEVNSWFDQIARALAYAHSKGVIHRDIKPGNIIISPDRSAAYLVDFGIALSPGDSEKLTENGYAVGTPAYMSPEQRAGQEVDATTDLYSLGVTLYEALAGRKVPVGAYEELAVINEAIPPEVDVLVRDCLLPADQRVPTAGAFAGRLAGASKPSKPLSEVLAHGRLHELGSALQDFTPQEFSKLPEGQRALIISKLTDILDSGEDQLEYACEHLLNLMLERGLLLPAEDYETVVTPAVEWAFEKMFGNYVGRKSIRLSLERAAHAARGPAHAVLAGAFLTLLQRTSLEDRDEWFLHAAREFLTTLLANPECGDSAGELAAYLSQVHRLVRAMRREPQHEGLAGEATGFQRT